MLAVLVIGQFSSQVNQCFYAVGWAAEGHLACKKQRWDAGVVMCLGQGADLHMAQLMPLQLTVSCSSQSILALPS